MLEITDTLKEQNAELCWQISDSGMFIITIPSAQFSIDALYVMHCYMFQPTVAINRY
jgi:hypothetical protein